MNNKKGFTLIELMISMFIGIIVFGGVFTTFRNQKVLYARQAKIIKINQDTRAALSLIKKYVKRAGISVSDCSVDNSDRICTGLSNLDISGKTFTVSSDLNLNGKVDVAQAPAKADIRTSESIRFSLIDNTLNICPDDDNNNCEFILDNVKTFKIQGFEGSNSSSDINLIDSLEITLQGESKDDEATENGNKLEGAVITARVFFINKTFQ